MMTTLYVCLGLVGFVILAGFAWRFASRRRSLPCPVWLRWMVELDNPFAKANRAEAILEHLDVRPGMVVLDVGCGPGRLTLPAARRVGETGEVIAIDLQPGMLRRAQERAEAAKLNNIRFLQVEMGGGHLQAGPIDRAVLVTVLGEIPNREAAMREIFGALKPGGVLAVSEIIFDPHFQSRKTVTRLANAVGFKEIAFFGNRFAYTMNLQKPAAV
jgi:ubiquinone/menaquinone biosynthesis C-methylase UbiE